MHLNKTGNHINPICQSNHPISYPYMGHVNPLTPMSDQDIISPYNINTISRRQVMRIKKNISYEIIS